LNSSAGRIRLAFFAALAQPLAWRRNVHTYLHAAWPHVDFDLVAGARRRDASAVVLHGYASCWNVDFRLTLLWHRVINALILATAGEGKPVCCHEYRPDPSEHV